MTYQASKLEDRFHCWPHMVGLTKVRPNKYTSMLPQRYCHDWLISSVTMKVFSLKYFTLYGIVPPQEKYDELPLHVWLENCINYSMLQSVKHLNDATLLVFSIRIGLSDSLLQKLSFAWCFGTWRSPHSYGS